MARSKLGDRNSFVWMNSYGSIWPGSRIPERSLATQARDTLARRSTIEHWSPAKMPDLAKHVLTLGSLNPQGKRLRVPTRFAARVDRDWRCDEHVRETDDRAPRRNGRRRIARELQSPSPVFPHSA